MTEFIFATAKVIACLALTPIVMYMTIAIPTAVVDALSGKDPR